MLKPVIYYGIEPKNDDEELDLEPYDFAEDLCNYLRLKEKDNTISYEKVFNTYIFNSENNVDFTLEFEILETVVFINTVSLTQTRKGTFTDILKFITNYFKNTEKIVIVSVITDSMRAFCDKNDFIKQQPKEEVSNYIKQL